ncbi:MAG TPA: hypothetical protein VGI60_13590 [Chthoniobacterales bacterium]
MRQRRAEYSLFSGRFGLGAILGLTILAAALLSSSPQLHEKIHPDSAATHQCAVSLFASAQCEATPLVSVPVAPNEIPNCAPFDCPAVLALPRLRFFALLEHAPPALA